MLNFARNLLGRQKSNPFPSFRINRPLVLLQSDDWGRVGVRDEEGFELLRAAGVRLGEHPYDLYSLETADDVSAIHELLKRHRDSTGRSACLEMNFVMANLDFEEMSSDGFTKLHLLPLIEGLPLNWKRTGLFEAYRAGIADAVFFPSLHGLTHFCQIAIENALAKNGPHAELLRLMWRAETPYIYWRMPWVGYEYNNPERPHAGFLPATEQTKLIEEAAGIFKQFFSRASVSACAPGYRNNRDTLAAWSKCGIRVAQNGTGAPLPPHMDEFEILNLHRTIDFEPSQKDLPIEKYVQLATGCFARGIPAIISVHAINFHSSLKDFRGPTLLALDEFLSALETKFPNMLYVNDRDAYEIVTTGKLRSARGTISVRVEREVLVNTAGETR
jgi:hypothetical protein